MSRSLSGGWGSEHCWLVVDRVVSASVNWEPPPRDDDTELTYVTFISEMLADAQSSVRVDVREGLALGVRRTHISLR